MGHVFIVKEDCDKYYYLTYESPENHTDKEVQDFEEWVWTDEMLEDEV